MKEIKKILLFPFILILIQSCSDPAPVEFIDNNLSDSNIQIEPAFNDIETGLNTSGYDSTGIINPYLNRTTIISIAGVNNTNFGLVQSEGYYYAIFNDKTKPVKLRNGKMLGYRSKNFSSVRFNNFVAIPVPYVVRFLDGMHIKDTVLGTKYFLKQRMMHNGMMNNFPFSSKISFKVIENRNSFTQFDIPTPAKIIGKISLDGNRLKRNLSLIFEWDRVEEEDVIIIIARIKNNTNDTEPLIKVKGNKHGKVKVPYSIIENVVSEQRKVLVISFIRKIEKEINNHLLNDTYIIAQSIHNIKIEIP